MPDNSELLRPAVHYFEKGQCPECGGTIAVAESEANYTILSQKGVPLDFQNVYYRCEGTCMKCNAGPFQMVRDGSSYRIYSELDQEIRMLKQRYTGKLKLTREGP